MEEPEKADKEARDRFLRKTEDSLKAADGVVTISEFSARAIRDRFGLAAEKIKVTYLGLSPIFAAPSSPAEIGGIRRKLDLPGEFLLFVGAAEKRKNLPALIEALALVHQKRSRLPLVLAGRSGGDQDAVRRAIEKRGLRSWVRQAGYLTDLEIRSLYHAASALVFPSLAEGFGLPLLEAMACGLPSAVSGVSALPEIGGDAALYFKPEDPKNIAAAIVRVLDDQSLRVALFQRGPIRAREFSWRRTAKTTLDFYRSTAGRS
jgi:alpha-1,3-rhamnosyl/mannosyltransferase